MQENWICVCRTYVLEDNFTFYFWQKFLLKMIWLELSSLCNDLTGFVCQKEKFYNLCIVKTQPRQQLRTVHFRKDLWCQIFMQYLRQKSLFLWSNSKGQLISECLFDFLNFPKNQRKIWQTSAPGSKKWSNQKSKDTLIWY